MLNTISGNLAKAKDFVKAVCVRYVASSLAACLCIMKLTAMRMVHLFAGMC